MKRNVDNLVRDYAGKTITHGEPTYKLLVTGAIAKDLADRPIVVAPAPNLTLQVACFTALKVQLPGDEMLNGTDKLRMYQLAHKISIGGVVDFTAEDVTLLKDRIGRAYDFITCGATYAMLEADYVES